MASSSDIIDWLEMIAARCEVDHMPQDADRLREAKAEIERLRERLGPRGLEVVVIDDAGHYVNEKVKAEIERLRTQIPSDAAQKSDDYQRGYMDGIEWATGKPSDGHSEETARPSEGMASLPLIPTSEMVRRGETAGYQAIGHNLSEIEGRQFADAAYRAMVDLALSRPISHAADGSMVVSC